MINGGKAPNYILFFITTIWNYIIYSTIVYTSKMGWPFSWSYCTRTHTASIAILCSLNFSWVPLPCRKRCLRMWKLLRRLWRVSPRAFTRPNHLIMSRGISWFWSMIFSGSPPYPLSATRTVPSGNWKYKAVWSRSCKGVSSFPPLKIVISCVDAGNGPLIHTWAGSSREETNSYFWRGRWIKDKTEWIHKEHSM